MDILFRLLPILPVYADLGGNVVGWAATLGGGIAAALIIVSLVKDVASYAKGSGDGSILKIVGKVIFLLFILGVIIYVKDNTDGGGLSGLADTAVTAANSELSSAINGAT